MERSEGAPATGEREAVIERYRVIMGELARLSRCGVTIFDHIGNTHVFASDNFPELFGGETGAAAECEADISDRIHPDDLDSINRYGGRAMELLENHSRLDDFKLTIEFRAKGRGGNYIRVIEQHSALEYDDNGQVWLSLSMLDISPDQTPLDGVRCQLVNSRTGACSPIDELFAGGGSAKLSKREAEILSLVREGMSSRRISEKLCISIHTVNTHRQRILEKLDAGNSFEAVRYASNSR